MKIVNNQCFIYKALICYCLTMIEIFKNKRLKRVENQRKKLGIKKLKKLLNVSDKEITKWEKSGKLSLLLENLEIIELYILIKESSAEDEMVCENQEFSLSGNVDTEEIKLPAIFFIACGILILLLVYVSMQFFIIQREIRLKISEPVSYWINAN